MKKLTLSLAALTFTALVAAPAFADFIPYGNAGHVAPVQTVFATGSSLDVYFYGSDASDHDFVKVFDVNTGTFLTGDILDNHGSTPGAEITVTGMTAGDQLEFFLDNTTNGQLYSSLGGASSADGFNHAYMTNYSGTSSNAAVDDIPAGVFVGFEDLPISVNDSGVCNGQSDCDYNDDEFVFVGVTPAATPEPSSLALLGTSVLGAAGLIRRRFSSR